MVGGAGRGSQNYSECISYEHVIQSVTQNPKALSSKFWKGRGGDGDCKGEGGRYVHWAQAHLGMLLGYGLGASTYMLQWRHGEG